MPSINNKQNKTLFSTQDQFSNPFTIFPFTIDNILTYYILSLIKTI